MAFLGTCNQGAVNAYIMAGLPVPYECRQFLATAPDWVTTPTGGPGRVGPAGTASPQEVANTIGQGISLGLQVFSQIYGLVTAINQQTQMATTASGQVPVTNLGPTTISGNGVSTTVEAKDWFSGTNLLVIGGLGLLAVIMLTGRRR